MGLEGIVTPFFQEHYTRGIEKGRKEGKRQGKEEGKKEGKKEGWREGLWEAIEMGLSIKFGENGMRLMSAIRSLEDKDRLNIIMKAVIKTDNLADIEALLN